MPQETTKTIHPNDSLTMVFHCTKCGKKITVYGTEGQMPNAETVLCTQCDPDWDPKDT